MISVPEFEISNPSPVSLGKVIATLTKNMLIDYWLDLTGFLRLLFDQLNGKLIIHYRQSTILIT